MPKKMVVVEEVEGLSEEKKSEETEILTEKDAKEDVSPEAGKVEESQKYDSVKFLWIIIPTTLLVGALAGGVLTYFSGIAHLENNESTPSPVPTTIVNSEVSSTSSPVSEAKRDDVKIQVLNGSGVAGMAGKAKTFLESLGYKDVVSGNASSSDFKKTEISIKEEKADYLDLLRNDLKEKYDISEKDGVLKTSSSYDVVITLGFE